MNFSKIKNKFITSILKGPDFNLQTRIVFYFSFLFVVTIFIIAGIRNFGVPYSEFTGHKKWHEEEELKHLNLIADLKKERLVLWIEQLNKDAKLICKENSIINFTKTKSLNPKGSNKNYPNGNFQNQLIQLRKKFPDYFKIQIISDDGVVLTSTHEREVNSKVTERNFTKIIKSQNVFINIINGRNNELNLSYYFPFIVSKYKNNNGSRSFVLVMHAKVEQFFYEISQTGEAFGATGEALVVNKESNVLNRLKFSLPDGSNAMPLEYKITALPATLAATGNEGVIAAKDYRNKEVLAAYRHIPISNNYGLGLIIKKDIDEIFAPLALEDKYTIIISLIGIFVLIIGSFFLAANLTKPIRQLYIVANEVKEGNFAVRAPSSSKGEMNVLFSTFNTMLKQIEGWQKNLEQLVIERTEKLEEANRKLNLEIESNRNISEELLKHKSNQEKIIKERTEELESANKDMVEKTVKIEESQKAMRYLLEDVNDARKELEQANSKLLSLNHELESFSYSVSHDLRAPLRAINGFTDKLSRLLGDDLSEEQTRVFKIIKSNTVKMAQLIDDLLEFSRMGRSEFKIREINMNTLFDEVISEVTEANKERNIEVVKGNLCNAKGDYKLVKQAVFNLIANAVKFTQYLENAKIEISCKKENSNIIYKVEDNGAGFNMDYSEKLFNVFQRLHSEKEFKGTGVGLAIVKRIITRHGGKVWAHSKENEGAEFYFTLNGKEKIN